MTSHLSENQRERIEAALASRDRTSGKTHNFYHYPARFSPEIASAIIEAFSMPDDVVLDPFMGGGTTIVEAIALGRLAVGTDLNELAHFVAETRTTPLSSADQAAVREWASNCELMLEYADQVPRADSSVKNLPTAIEEFMALGRHLHNDLRMPRQRSFARCALLRLGQWALDCRDFDAPKKARLAKQLPVIVEELLKGMDSFVDACRTHHLFKSELTGRRCLVHRSAIDLHQDSGIKNFAPTAKLVVTSPPYPGVHVLYHRWQIRGRKETSAPYWIADVSDGEGGAYYTAGSRTPTGVDRYFDTIRRVFTSVHEYLADHGIVAQLVGFNDMQVQLPRYLDAMKTAGFDEVDLGSLRLGRRVPNRRWYAQLKGNVDASAELLLIHRKTRS